MSLLNKHNNNSLFLTTGCVNPHSKTCVENERAITNHECNIREKSDITDVILDNAVSNPEIKVVAFVSNFEARHVTNNNSDNIFCDDVINSLQYKPRNEYELWKLKISIVACDILDS